MNRFKLVAIILLSIISLNILAQESELSELDSLIDEILVHDDDLNNLHDLIDGTKKYHFLYMNTGFNNKTLFAGREIGDNMYNLSGQLYYFISNGFYLGAAGTWYSQMDPGYQTTAISAGYSNGKPKFRYRISYSRYIYSISDFDPQISNSVNMGITLKSKKSGTRADYTANFGKSFSSSLSLDLYTKINLVKMNRYDKLTFEPQVSFYYGTDEIETLVTNGRQGMPGYTSYYETNEKFGLLNTEIELPVYFSYKDLLLGISYTYNFTHSLDDVYDYPNTHIFGFTLGYIFTLKK